MTIGVSVRAAASGFSGLVLSLGATVSARTAEAIGAALQRRGVREVLGRGVREVVDWCREELGESVRSFRRRAYTEPKGATDRGGTGSWGKVKFSSGQARSARAS